MNPEIIKITKAIPRLICMATLLYAAILKLVDSGKYVSGFPFKQLFSNEVTIILAAFVIAFEICIAYENILPSGNFKREKAVLLASIFSVFLLVSLTRLVPYVNTNYFPHGCACFPVGSVGWLDFESPIGQIIRNTILFAISLLNLAIVFKFEDKHENMPKPEPILT